MDREVEEIRRRRRQIIREEYGGSVHALVEDAIAWQKKHPDKVKRLRAAGSRSAVAA